ncbi:MAG: lytic transglycosylase domain-containing protein [Clostridiales bacterium]|nr:lytic transglycosylase domain-containing protein [Clostridiales bacterium]
MAKKLVSVWLSLAILLSSTITIYAEDEVQGQFLNRNIDINGNRIANYYLEYPLFTYDGTTYFPLTQEMGELLGFDVEMDWESRTLKILKKEPVRTVLAEEVLKSNLENPKAIVLNDVSVLMMAEKERKLKLPVKLQGVSMSAEYLDIASQLKRIREQAGLIKIPELAVEPMDLNDKPVLQVDDVIYLPIRKLTGNSCFGWDVYYDNYSGIYISTENGVPAYSYFDKAESDYNKGLANYIMSRNKNITPGGALMLVFLFKHEADVYDVDELLLIAMAQRESTFRADAIGGRGPVGLMQIMPKTAQRYGISRDELFDPHVNIEFGARYISSHLDQYNDETLALCAYNQGGGAVSRGTYNTRYARNITGTQETLKNYLIKNGYGLGE